MRTFHVRNVPRDRVIATIVRLLREQGLSQIPAYDFDTPAKRRLVVYGEGAWVGVADEDLFTTWGEDLSRALDVPALALDGECDHAFFTEISLYEGGKLAGQVMVPEHVKLERDGRHRIRPTFLAKMVPSAKKALAEGIVVDALGGTGNAVAVGEVLGIPRPMLSTQDDENDDVDVVEDDAKVTLLFRAGNKGRVAPPAVAAELLGDKPEKPRLESFTSGGTSGWVGTLTRVTTCFQLSGVARARGVEVEIEGNGLALLDPETITARVFTPNAEELVARVKRTQHSRRCTFREIELLRAEGNIFTRVPGDDPSTVVVAFETPTRAVGEGELRVHARTLDPRSEAGTELVRIGIKPALGIPVVPSFAKPTAEADGPYLEAYAGRDFAGLWVGFDVPWKKAAALVTRLAELALPMVSNKVAARVVRKGGEELNFRKPVVIGGNATWSKIEEELVRGANVHLYGREALTAPYLEIRHQPEGFNLFPTKGERRYPRVELSWSVPRPAKSKAVASLASIARDTLRVAGGLRGCLGGIAVAQGKALSSLGETPYEHIARTRMRTYDRAWLETHVRAPGWTVLAPTAVG